MECFSSLHSCLSIWLVMTSRHERKSFCLLVASVLNRNLNSSHSCLLFVLCHDVILPLLRIRRCVCVWHHSPCPPFSQRSCKTPSHLTFTGLCNLKALQSITTLPPWHCLLPFPQEKARPCSCLGSCLNAHTHSRVFSSLGYTHRLCVNPKPWYKHPVYTLQLIDLQGNNDSCMALYY